VPLAALLVGKNHCGEAVLLLQRALAALDDEGNAIDRPQVLLLLDACGSDVDQGSGKQSVDPCTALRALPGVEVES
jgi:hypothetical protein